MLWILVVCLVIALYLGPRRPSGRREQIRAW